MGKLIKIILGSVIAVYTTAFLFLSPKLYKYLSKILSKISPLKFNFI